MRDSLSALVTIESALQSGAILAHKDGNHGALYPKVDEFGPVGVPFLTAKLLSGGGVDIAGAPRLPDEHADKLRLGFVQPGDVLLSHNATIGRVAVVPPFDGRLLIGTSLTCFRVNRAVISPRYLAAYFTGEHFQSQLRAVMSQTTRNQIPISAQRKLSVVLPPIALQESIASLLGAFDDRIAVLRESNATLEAIAQALFKSWFVDFDPVRAKQQGLAPAGMDEATAASFPESFDESALGALPTGWRVATLADAFEINPVRTLKKGAVSPYLDMAGVATTGHCVERPVLREFGSGTKFRNGDTLLARITPCLENGKSAFVAFLDADQVGWGSTEFIVLRPKAPFPEYLGYLLCRHPPFREYAIRSMSGTSGRQRVQNDVLGRYPLAAPTEAVAAAFAELVNPLQQAIAGNHARAQTLAILRGNLLPRLISGQLRLPQPGV